MTETVENKTRMSWDEIVKVYPDCWVGLIDVDWEDESNVRSAVVMYTDRSADELALMQLRSDNLYSAYTTPDNLGPMGVVGYLS